MMETEVVMENTVVKVATEEEVVVGQQFPWKNSSV